MGDVRFGSKADVCVDVRFTPESGHAVHKRMSALGQKQTYAAQKGMSALPPSSDRESGLPQTVMSALPLKADLCGATRNVRYGPIVDTATRATEGAPCRDLSEIQSDDLILFPSAPSPVKAKKAHRQGTIVPLSF